MYHKATWTLRIVKEYLDRQSTQTRGECPKMKHACAIRLGTLEVHVYLRRLL